MPAPSAPQTIPDVTEDIETGSGSGLGRSRDNGIFDQIRANDAVYFCSWSRPAGCFRQHLSDLVGVLKCMLAFENFPTVDVLVNRWMKGYGHEKH